MVTNNGVPSRGRDGYAVTAPLTGEAVERLIKGKFRSAGAKAPGEIFDAKEILNALGSENGLGSFQCGQSGRGVSQEL